VVVLAVFLPSIANEDDKTHAASFGRGTGYAVRNTTAGPGFFKGGGILYELALNHFFDVDVSDQAGAKATFITKMNELRDSGDTQFEIVFAYLVCALHGYLGNASYQCVDQDGTTYVPNDVWYGLQIIISPVATFGRQGVAYGINTGYLNGDVYWFSCGGDLHAGVRALSDAFGSGFGCYIECAQRGQQFARGDLFGWREWLPCGVYGGRIGDFVQFRHDCRGR
jgi:hypothetical protein